MAALSGKRMARVKRFIVDRLVEPLLPKRRVEAWIVFWARLVFLVHRPLVIGITGSVGKSTTTALLATVLSHPDAQRIVGRVGSSVDNMNDDVGVSATLLRFPTFYTIPWPYPQRLATLVAIPARALRVMLGPYPRVMVIEFGVGSTASFRRMVTIAPPRIGVVTAIGAAHLELLKTLDGIVAEKGELVRAVPSSGLVVLGDGHPHVSDLERMARAAVVKVGGSGVALSQNVARAVAAHLGVPDETVEAALRDFKMPAHRLERRDLGHLTVIDDTYNANPLSMRLGIDTLVTTAAPARRRLAVLGYMGELGEEAPRYHRELGEYARSRVDLLIGVGALARHYDPHHWFESSVTCAAAINALVRDGDCVLVKGSFALQMEHVVHALARASHGAVPTGGVRQTLDAPASKSR